ncbi:Uncharacterised protein [Mycobacteroides abscessus subsp. abscessus]|nr:Uncharacterised protein [Mycobacteroides abscessus subsp. abscessus]
MSIDLTVAVPNVATNCWALARTIVSSVSLSRTASYRPQPALRASVTVSSLAIASR